MDLSDTYLEQEDLLDKRSVAVICKVNAIHTTREKTYFILCISHDLYSNFQWEVFTALFTGSS